MTIKALVSHQAVTFNASGLTGATAASRYVGATASGAPTTGTFAVGDFVVAQNGHIFVCTAAGTPGTWTDVAAGGGVTLASSVTSETTYGIAAAVGTSTAVARQDHTHGSPATPVTSAVAGTGISLSGSTGAVTITNTGATSVAGRTGAVTLTAADIGAGTFPGANAYSGLQTFNAGLTIPSGQPLTTGTRSVFTGTRSTTTNASDTVNLGTFSTTGGALELVIHASLAAPAAGSTASVTKVYEFAANSTMGTVSTWYVLLPVDASGNSVATNDFALEVQRTAAGTFLFRFRQKSIGVAGAITFTVESLGDSTATFTSSSTVTAAPAAVTTPHPSNSLTVAAGNVGIGTDAPGSLLAVDSTAAGVLPFAVRVASGQTTNAQEWQNSSGTATGAVDSAGRVCCSGGFHAGGVTHAGLAYIEAFSGSTVNPAIIARGASGQTADVQQCQDSTGTVNARVTAGGNVQGTGAYTTLSDAVVKRNIRPLEHDPIDILRRLRPVHFDYTDGDTDQVGFVAQDVQPVLPNAVVPFGDRLGLRTDAIFAYALAALQTIEQRLTALET